IRDNDIRNLRSGIGVFANSSQTIISGNVIDNTKGSILLRSDVQQINGNASAEHGNEWDIVVLTSVHPAAPSALTLLPDQSDLQAYGSAVMGLSAANGDMSVLDRRFAEGNRSAAW